MSYLIDLFYIDYREFNLLYIYVYVKKDFKFVPCTILIFREFKMDSNNFVLELHLFYCIDRRLHPCLNWSLFEETMRKTKETEV